MLRWSGLSGCCSESAWFNVKGVGGRNGAAYQNRTHSSASLRRNKYACPACSEALPFVLLDWEASTPSIEEEEATGPSARYDDQSSGRAGRSTSAPSFRMKTSRPLN